ncbi:Drug resistance protein [Penicillium atrosanguineum]|uniref:Gem-associated protein 5 TPR domain-containing protein n=1 Tax=Penicillium atrosanguineum TaxID=1132637 RepID=A0A9W9Q3A9_9EURO|nr:Drug resistance protein [Penicillium atrosanguineum]KAJ5141808.1 hypothetical protein N7526_002803 [Penicillium atrosanguineum]KAJ5298403.1 Drug resistance protein [Penicillium atrosanguineum]KAJ5321328.1 hypothetical protein N7476_004330 [Penicillium atrosanguineum]
MYKMAELTWNRSLVLESRPLKTVRAMAPPPPESRFEPCASTASLFLYAQSSTILCLHHDTLAVERRFDSHQEDVEFISVDNVSERGAGRLVVSYDVGQTAIVWDIFTGTEIARFASFEHLRVASWMRNGSVAFGNGKGEVILFEPPTSEHISARTIFDPITALAPATDCRTYAIGYQNGSILIANLLPQFTILHTLTTSRGPSPILSLAWHASSSKQKSDMLATQSSNGDLRVWSVAKPPVKESPRVIRVLKRSDSNSADPKWMCWSKNGRIIQYLEGETWSWDVRTKHVTYEPIPTIDGVRGMANYGPTATLFTIGPQNTVQQYDLDNPAMVANVQHVPIPSRPVASENGRSRTMSPRRLQDPPNIREKGHGRRTPFDANGMDSVSQQRADLISPASSRSRTESVSSKASSGRYKLDRPFSPPSRSGQSATTFSLTSAGRDTPQPSASFQYASSVSMSSVKSSRAASRLRNEVHMSPAEKNIVDLFPFTRARLNDVPYKQAPPLDETHLTPEDLRQQMLSVVFGWEGDIQDLIRDELSRHAVGSQSAILLTQWLGETDSDQMAAMISSGQVTTVDWMLLALSQMSGHAQANKVGQAFVQKLLEMGDVHTSASILLGLGDSNDAIEVYVSRNHFMEAILMTCLLMPSDWQRQSYLVRRWGEYVVSHSQQQLAIRCFMCTGAEPTEPWTSPAAQQAASFAEIIRGKSPLASPDPMQSSSNLMLPPNRPKSASNQRPAGKTPALKLITSFDPQPNQRFRFPGLKSDDRTPTNAPGVTPIAESAVADSALSPGGLGSWKLNNIQSLSQAMTSRSGTPAWNRRRLPSIGETPVDVHPPSFSRSGSYQKSGYGSTSENDETSGQEPSQDEQGGDGGLLLSATRYAPEGESLKPSPQTAVQAAEKFASIKGLPSPGPGLIEALREYSDIRNGSRDRKPDGLQIELVHAEELLADGHDQSDLLPVPSAKSTTSTLNSYSSAKSPSVSGRSIDQYISSLEEANYHSKKHRGHRSHGRERGNTDETASQSSRTHHPRDPSQESRGRNERRYIQPAKRSPSSPIPMSPEELARYHVGEPGKTEEPRKTQSRARSSSKMRKGGSRSRQRSSSRNKTAQFGGDKNDPSSRGRSVDRQSSTVRSPSSPLPMSLPTQDSSPQENADDPLRIVTGNQKRLRSRHRSASRRRGASSKRDPSTESKSGHKVSYSQPEIRQVPKPQIPADSQGLELLSAKTFGQVDVFADAMNQHKSDSNDEAQDLVSPTTPFVSLAERKRRELAAAELEARRLSLARHPSAPNIPFPGELQSARTPVESPPPFHGNSYFPRVPSRNKIPPSKNSPEYQSSSDSSSSRSGMPVGLPATPRAMRHPKYGGGYEEARPPSVPALPTDNFGSLLLTDARYQGEAERIGRSMSVPVPQDQHHRGGTIPSDVPMHPRFNPNLPRSRSNSRSRMGHRRTSSGTSPHVTVSIEETIENAMQYRPSAPQIDLIPPPPPPPPILPELQHLKNTPPPPPPAPFHEAVSPRESSATIDIAIDNHEMGHLLPRAMTAAPALTSTETRQAVGRRMSFDHRRNRSSNESFTNKLRSLTRMRSNSRSVEPWTSHHDTEMPYESVHSHGHFSSSQGPAYVKGDLTSFL